MALDSRYLPASLTDHEQVAFLLTLEKNLTTLVQISFVSTRQQDPFTLVGNPVFEPFRSSGWLADRGTRGVWRTPLVTGRSAKLH